MSSVRIIFTDPADVTAAVSSYAKRLRSERPEVVSLYWYGSWVNGDYSPASDADICVVVKHSDLSRRDRLPLYLPEFFPVGVDLCVYTVEEFTALEQGHSSWYRTITEGKKLI